MPSPIQDSECVSPRCRGYVGVEKNAMHDQEGGSYVGGKRKRVASRNEVILDSTGTTDGGENRLA